MGPPGEARSEGASGTAAGSRALAAPLALRTALLLLLGAGSGVGLNTLRSDGFAPTAFVAETTCSTAAGPAVRVLPAAHAAHLCGRPDVLVADVRSAARFAEGHVAGAVHLPCASSGDVLGRALDGAHDKRTVVVYGETTGDAEPVATALRGRLPRTDLEIVVLAGGFAAWNAAGHACSSGPCPECGVHAQDEAKGK